MRDWIVFPFPPHERMFRRTAHSLVDKTMGHLRSRPERQRQPEEPDEDAYREGDQRRREREILQRAHVARGVGADEHEHRDGGNEAKPLQRDPEQHDGQDRDADRPRLKARYRRAVERKRAQRDDQPKRGKQRPYQRRKHGRPHAMHVAEPVLLREEDKAAADGDEDQPRPEILRRTDAHHFIRESTRRVGKGAVRIVVETHAGACAVPTRHSVVVRKTRGHASLCPPYACASMLNPAGCSPSARSRGSAPPPASRARPTRPRSMGWYPPRRRRSAP